MIEWFKSLPIEPSQFIYAGVAVGGGIARYLNSFVLGGGFNFYIFCASVFVSAFSGYMFSLVGLSLSMPTPFVSIMAGVGGFFGDQTMKLVLEYVQGKIPPNGNSGV